jgi:predicted  nucleic acid-binding Zn-ribbon protein
MGKTLYTQTIKKGLKILSYLPYLQSQLSEKKEQLIRLKNCVTKLDDLQNEFIQNQKLVKDPELTSSTWQGTLANKFEEIREDLSFSFKDISQTQLNIALTTLENKIESINIEIQSLQNSIEAEKARIEMERRKERAEQL